MNLFRHAALASLIFGAIAALPTSANAQRTDEERARDHYEAGTSYFEQRRFAEAATQFRDSYRLSQHPELLLNIATSLERSGDFEGAANAIDEWLDAVPADEPDRRTQELRRDQARARAEEAAPPPEPEPEPQPSPEAVPPPAPRPPPPRFTAVGKLGIGLIAAGVVLAGVSIGTGIAADSDQNALEEGCDMARICPVELESTRDRGQTLARTSTAFTFLAIASAGAGLTALVLDLVRDDDEEEDGRGAHAAPGPGQLGLGLDVRF